mmetsp:Transcript_21867/g.51567  ORF Transcript_21867/g.51567 Transcript_21867/m.51567 type:complete len:586 (+) Transcript_21867:89-1846(+)
MKHYRSLLLVVLAAEVATAKQCYDLEVHSCGCAASVCTESKCSSTGGIWSDQCPGEECVCPGDGDASTEEIVKDNVFVDDAGTSHVIPAGATIVLGTMDAVALSHFGLTSDRVVATMGERSSSGSNHGGFYYDGNIAYGELDHGSKDYDPSVFPADPDEEERAFLDSIEGDLSSGCSDTNYYCDLVDTTILDEIGWPDVVIVGSFYSSLLTDEVRGNFTEKGVPVIELKNAYGDDDAEAGNIRNMIEMIERMESLAKTLGLDVHGSTVVKDDKEKLCEAAATFQEAAAEARGAGARAMAAYMPYQANEPGKTGAFLPNPDRDPVLSMMQNLGLAILHNEHSGDYWENRAGDYAPGSGNFLANETKSVSGQHAYNVDFWLYDDRVALDFLSDEFANDWPQPAVTAKQYAYWPSNARILSYRHAAEILNVVAGSLASAERLTPETTCTEPTSDSQFRELGPGEYSCEKIYPIDFCEVQDDNVFDHGSTPVDITASTMMTTTTSSSVTAATTTTTTAATTVVKTAKPAVDPAPKEENSDDASSTAISEETPSSLPAESEDSGTLAAGAVDVFAVAVAVATISAALLSF